MEWFISKSNLYSRSIKEDARCCERRKIYGVYSFGAHARPACHELRESFMTNEVGSITDPTKWSNDQNTSNFTDIGRINATWRSIKSTSQRQQLTISSDPILNSLKHSRDNGSTIDSGNVAFPMATHIAQSTVHQQGDPDHDYRTHIFSIRERKVPSDTGWIRHSIGILPVPNRITQNFVWPPWQPRPETSS